MIRRATTQDIPEINKLLYQVQKVHSDGRPDIFVSGGKKYTDEELKSIIVSDDTPVYVYVCEDGGIAGYAFCIFQHTPDSNTLRERRTLYIDDLCVNRDMRRHHIGSLLYGYVVNVARSTGCNSVTLNVWELNDSARRFYESCGMRPLKTVMEQPLS